MHIQRAFALAIAAACHLAAQADTLPARLTGTWSTSASPGTELGEHNEFYLEADGFGAAVGSTASVRIAGGADDGKPGPRAVIGFPVRATSNGDMLTLHPFAPAGTPADQAARAASVSIACRYDAPSATLNCTGPDGKTSAMQRLSDTVPDEVGKMLAALRAQAPKP